MIDRFIKKTLAWEGQKVDRAAAVKGKPDFSGIVRDARKVECGGIGF